MDESETLFSKEMERLERQQNNLRDQWNTESKNQDENEYKRIINSNNTLNYAIRKAETLEKYLIRIEDHVAIANKTNWKVHVIIGSKGKPWYTHKNPNGCFMCDDTNMLNYFINLFKAIAVQHPKTVLLP